MIRAVAAAGLLACTGDLGIGDRLCTSDGGCPGEERCVVVTVVRAGTGECLASAGVEVCRAVCTSCPPPSPCGCVCP